MLKRRFLALLLAAILLVGLVPALSAEARADGDLKYWIGVDVKNQRTTIYSTADNSVVHCWLCTPGAAATITTLPIGRLQITQQISISRPAVAGACNTESPP